MLWIKVKLNKKCVIFSHLNFFQWYLSDKLRSGIDSLSPNKNGVNIINSRRRTDKSHKREAKKSKSWKRFVMTLDLYSLFIFFCCSVSFSFQNFLWNYFRQTRVHIELWLGDTSGVRRFEWRHDFQQRGSSVSCPHSCSSCKMQIHVGKKTTLL